MNEEPINQDSAHLPTSSTNDSTKNPNHPSTTTAESGKTLKERIMESIMGVHEEEDAHGEKDICRVCRLAGDDTLYHPCLCTGSIKYVHQECLLQWLKYSKKDVCELCNHKFSFRPLYRPDMPERLPIWDLLKGVFLILARFMRLSLTYALVASCWLGLVPLMAARIHRLVFSGLLSSFFSSRILQLFSTENVAFDIARGSLVVTIFLCTFISLVWLREQIMIGGPGHLLHLHDDQQQPPVEPQNPQGQVQQRQQAGQRPNRMEAAAEHRNDAQLGRESKEDIKSGQQPSTSLGLGHGIEDGEPSTSQQAAERINTHRNRSPELDRIEQQQPSAQPIANQSPATNSRPLHIYQPVQQALVGGGGGGGDNNVAQQQQQAENPAEDGQNGGEPAAEVDPQQQQRFVDELTWQRLLGLDGSFTFIEHVFWTISLNVVFNIVFLYFPAQIGSSVLALFGFGPGKVAYFELPISILAGLVVILMHGLVIHRIAKIFRLKTLYTTAGIICLMLKVFLLVVVELIFFPILCGWWLDICSLPLTGITLEERIRVFKQYPSSSMFLHWLAGMVYVFYSASFILILRELLRPGVLWFIRNLNDPDFNPIQEMIEQPVPRHFRRLVASMTLFFSIILLVIYVPLRTIKWLLPSTLPYVFSGSADTPLVEYSFELVLLQVIMPAILEYSKAYSLLKRAVRFWCRVVGGWLLLDSYLLPADKEKRHNVEQQHQRQRARERLLRGDQEEQIGLLEALEAIEDDTTDEEEGEGERPVEGGDEMRREEAQNDEEAHDDEEVADDTTEEESGEEAEEEEQEEKVVEEAAVQDQANQDQQPVVAGADHQAVIEGMPAVDEGQAPQQNNADDNGEEFENVADQPPVQNEEQLENQQIQQQIQRIQAQRQLEQRNLGAQHQALLRFRDPAVTEDYVRPNCFPLRIALLLLCVAATAIAISLIFFLVPVTIGRLLLSAMALTNQPVHDLYTIAVGLYACWLCIRLALLSREWARKGWAYMKKVFNSAAWLILRLLAASFPLLVVIPFMLGFYFQMLVISPIRVAIFQSPLFFPWKEWAMGVVHFKILCASVLMGPDWWLKTAFEQIYADGIWNFRLRDLYVNLVFPIINALAFLIAFPYALSKSLLFFTDASREEEVIITRYAYPCLLGSICFSAFLAWQWQKLKMLAQKIRNDKYLIGTQLVNFYRENTPAIGSSSTSTAAGTASAANVAGGGDDQQQPAGGRNVEEQKMEGKGIGREEKEVGSGGRGGGTEV